MPRLANKACICSSEIPICPSEAKLMSIFSLFSLFFIWFLYFPRIISRFNTPRIIGDQSQEKVRFEFQFI
jgi:hypothetical protein